MARVLFAVCGVGLGHAGRSSILIKNLSRRHELLITSYSEGLPFLKKEFGKVEALNWFKYYFHSDGRIDRLKSIAFNSVKVPFVLFHNFSRLRKIIREFRPEVIVSDFDFNGLYAGKLSGIKVILISNMHLANYFKTRLSFSQKIAYSLTDELMLRAYFSADCFLVTSIMKPENSGRMEFFHPLVREDLAGKKPQDQGFFLAYASKENLQNFTKLFREFPDKRFVVYGSSRKHGNVEFKSFSREDWADDMLNCSGVLCHGGMGTISEAVVLKKPVYVTASIDWFERFHNGAMVKELGFGVAEENPSMQGLTEFFSGNKKFSAQLKKANIKASNKEFKGRLEELIQQYSKQ